MFYAHTGKLLQLTVGYYYAYGTNIALENKIGANMTQEEIDKAYKNIHAFLKILEIQREDVSNAIIATRNITDQSIQDLLFSDAMNTKKLFEYLIPLGIIGQEKAGEFTRRVAQGDIDYGTIVKEYQDALDLL